MKPNAGIEPGAAAENREQSRATSEDAVFRQRSGRADAHQAGEALGASDHFAPDSDVLWDQAQLGMALGVTPCLFVPETWGEPEEDRAIQRVRIFHARDWEYRVVWERNDGTQRSKRYATERGAVAKARSMSGWFRNIRVETRPVGPWEDTTAAVLK